MSYRFNLSDLR